MNLWRLLWKTEALFPGLLVANAGAATLEELAL